LEDIVSLGNSNQPKIDTIIEFPSRAIEVTFTPLRSNTFKISKFSLARPSLDTYGYPS